MLQTAREEIVNISDRLIGHRVTGMIIWQCEGVYFTMAITDTE